MVVNFVVSKNLKTLPDNKKSKYEALTRKKYGK